MNVPDLFCLADNRKGDPDSMGPLDFYNPCICRIEQAYQKAGSILPRLNYIRELLPGNPQNSGK
jgi:hypothetical protein